MNREQRMIWIDCEMTGLDVERQRLVEIACIITEADLTEVATFGPIIIHQSEEILENMHEWCKNTFEKNGLIDEIRESTVTEQQAETEFLAFLQEHTSPLKCHLAGNSVSADRLFINKYMPSIGAHLHHRIIDVSSIKELTKRWYPKIIAKKPSKELNHRAFKDIQASITELKFYREHIFISQAND